MQVLDCTNPNTIIIKERSWRIWFWDWEQASAARLSLATVVGAFFKRVCSGHTAAPATVPQYNHTQGFSNRMHWQSLQIDDLHASLCASCGGSGGCSSAAAARGNTVTVRPGSNTASTDRPAPRRTQICAPASRRGTRRQRYRQR